MKAFVLLLNILFMLSCNNRPAQTNTVKRFEISDVTGEVSSLLPIPNSMHLTQAVKWVDNKGENLLLLYETGKYWNSVNETGTSAKLTAVLYNKSDSGFKEMWKMVDFVEDCEVDVTCNFYKNHLSVSDLDENGVAEIMMVYAVSCKGDVSPNTKKLILYQGGTKYAIRGEEELILQKDTIRGTFRADALFADLPAVISDSALHHYQKFGITKYE